MYLAWPCDKLAAHTANQQRVLVAPQMNNTANVCVRWMLLFCFIVPLSSLGAVSPGRVQRTRAFSAQYDVCEVRPLDATHSSVRIVVRLQNHSGAALNDGSLVVQDASVPLRLIKPLATGVHVQDREFTTISRTVTVATSSYQHWLAAPPSLVLEFTNAAGGTQRYHVEVVRIPGLGAQP
jgi:hypothetical protein